ncbi:MAG: HIT family protein [Parcubacteria group bacterium]|nr:HIT family protein [Parcubacteria group bacterium]
MTECIFCSIAAGSLSSAKIYEDDTTCAFLDVHPSSSGHTLIIPKVHARTILDLPPRESAILIETVKKVMQRISDVLRVDGFTVGWNHAAAAGQVVEHLHVHVIPRSGGDGGSPIQSVVHRPRADSVEELAHKLRIV